MYPVLIVRLGGRGRAVLTLKGRVPSTVTLGVLFGMWLGQPDSGFICIMQTLIQGFSVQPQSSPSQAVVGISVDWAFISSSDLGHSIKNKRQTFSSLPAMFRSVPRLGKTLQSTCVPPPWTGMELLPVITLLLSPYLYQDRWPPALACSPFLLQQQILEWSPQWLCIYFRRNYLKGPRRRPKILFYIKKRKR